tara:strand:+ start:382 stop:1206 length:825 start_codon:yes stop_codon:yes gene_type:complete
MSEMAINLDNQGLRSIISEYDLLFIDIWGVIHNGIELYKESIEVLNKLENEKKEYVLLTNAPRPNSTVIKYLKKMGLENEKCKKVYTSGEAALSYLSKNLNKSKFYHIGPPRDFDLFKLFEKNKVKDINESEFILCTGLFEDQETELEYYKNLLKRKDKIKMVCTNPDLIVDRGENREYCAGSVAKIFEEIGGQVEYFGKPYPLVYEQSIKLKNKKILCIGDNLNTDIKGANLQNFSSLLISGGIHRNEINNNLKDIFSKYNVNVDFIQSKLKW